jgi:hypothetical protein
MPCQALPQDCLLEFAFGHSRNFGKTGGQAVSIARDSEIALLRHCAAPKSTKRNPARETLAPMPGNRHVSPAWVRRQTRCKEAL